VHTVHVDLGPRSYPIHIDAGLLTQPDLWRPGLGQQVLVVTDDRVAPLYLPTVRQGLPGHEMAELVLPAGEATKCVAQWSRILDALVERRFERGCTVVALGGGVIGDLAGFAAASYQRGVQFVQMPTTLLAQVDSSVGGKTGINHPGGKNLIGAFHQPAQVIIDTQTLATLPAREVSAGLAEVIKYGAIADDAFLGWLEHHMPALRALDHEALTHALGHSCAIKARIVGADERESAERALLNFGHTFGHAIENLLGYGDWLHGEAVAAGMAMAADFCVRLGLIEPAASDRLKALIVRAGGPIAPPQGLDPERFLAQMRGDKKAQGGRIRLVLLRRLGEAVLTADYPESELAQFLLERLG